MFFPSHPIRWRVMSICPSLVVFAVDPITMVPVGFILCKVTFSSFVISE